VQTIPTIDLYRELEVDPSAAPETIEAAWKSLMKRHHPDVSSETGAVLGRVKRLNLAHEWLTDPPRRAMYDRSRRWPGSTPTPPAEAEAAHNPYAEHAETGRRSVPMPASDGPKVNLRPQLRQRPTMLISVGLVTVLIVVAISSFLASPRTSPAAAPATGMPVLQTLVPSGVGRLKSPAIVSGPLQSAAVDAGALPPADLAAELPSACRTANVSRAFSFRSQLGGGPAAVFVVPCDATRSFGPLVYGHAVDGWRLRAKGGLQDGYPQQGFSGGLSGKSSDEFGIAWTHGDGTTSTITLYRVANRLDSFWDSGSIGLSWSFAWFTYESAPDPAVAGLLVVISADLSTGTPNCMTCKDHRLYRDFYSWQESAATPGLVRTARQAYGFGP
jgi:hypothetical protein